MDTSHTSSPLPAHVSPTKRVEAHIGSQCYFAALRIVVGQTDPEAFVASLEPIAGQRLRQFRQGMKVVDRVVRATKDVRPYPDIRTYRARAYEILEDQRALLQPGELAQLTWLADEA